VATAAVSAAIRRVADDASSGLPGPWRVRLAAAADSRRADLDDALDRAVGAARLPTARPRWWRAVGVVQWLLAATMVVGLLWLLAIFVVAWMKLPDLPTPELGVVPWPTVLAIGGAAAGLLLAAVAGWATRVGARRRAAVARRRLSEAATGVGRELVIAPLDAELVTLARLHELVGRLRG
jgi:hypothetical protein